MTGLTPVHVNRTLQSLRKENVISVVSGRVQVFDWDQLIEIGDFDPSYLQLETSQEGGPPSMN